MAEAARIVPSGHLTPPANPLAELMRSRVALLASELQVRGHYVSPAGWCYPDAAATLLPSKRGTGHLSAASLANMRSSGKGPRWIRAGQVVYRLEDLIAYLDGLVVEPTAK